MTAQSNAIAFRHPTLGAIEISQEQYGFALEPYPPDLPIANLSQFQGGLDTITLGAAEFRVSPTEYIKVTRDDKPYILIGGHHNAAVHFMSRYSLFRVADVFLHVDHKHHPDNEPINENTEHMLAQGGDQDAYQDALASGAINVANYVTVVNQYFGPEMRYTFLHELRQAGDLIMFPPNVNSVRDWGGVEFASREDIHAFVPQAGVRYLMSGDLDIFYCSPDREALYQRIAAIAHRSAATMFFTSPGFNKHGIKYAERFLREHVISLSKKQMPNAGSQMPVKTRLLRSSQ